VRARAVLAGLLLVVGVAPLRADAAPPGGYLVVSGSVSAYVDVTIKHAFVAHMGVFEPKATAPRVTTRGAYAGVWIEPVGRPNDGTGFFTLPATDTPDGERHVMGFDAKPKRFGPGRYRVHLVTDGRSELRIQADGLPYGLTLAPRHRVPSWGRVVDVRTTPADVAGEETLSFRVRKGSRTMLGAWIDAPGSVSMTSTICLTQPGSPVPCPLSSRGWSNAAGDGRRGWAAEWWHFGVGTLPPTGEQDVDYVQSTPGVTPPDDLLAFAITWGGQ
jgi:hypothetical protein